ncbi:hypothetical protein L1987_32427 [Smallanthus sonchifolius]|uniref:Uncharacterized protein n=1 Tax=Smallanthus sonchifolius TaxID=185202 RepID=A0ACB9HMZ8_9ASTR|nr:hypothetical protein L1987_32427 [Smallanthus sonchifolius]
MSVVSWSLCQYSRQILINECESLMEIFETQGINNNDGGGSSTNIDEGNNGTNTTTMVIPRVDNINMPQLSILEKLVITFCNLLQHVFIFSTLESLTHLKELMLKECEEKKVIVKKENGQQRKVEFPCLKSLELHNLPNLEGFFLGTNAFEWPLLEKVVISKCPQMIVFTYGLSTTPKLKYIHTSLGKHSLECGLNFHETMNLHQVNL